MPPGAQPREWASRKGARERARRARCLTGIQQYSNLGHVKATIEVPDEIYRRVKAKTALQGRAIRDVTVELYQKWLEEAETEASPKASMYDRMKHLCGVVKSGVGDLSNNPKHLKDLDRDSMGHRR